MKVLDEIPDEWETREGVSHRFRKGYSASDFPWDAFPTVCEKCGREMLNPTRQIFCDEIMIVRTGDLAGKMFVRRELPVGAMFEAIYYRDIPDWCGRDGMALMVVTPDGEWHVDGRANNCTMPEDKLHRCWVRSGNPRDGYCHVDKDGLTCAAGAGSIWMRAPHGWHGFLHRGYLVDADGNGREVVDRMLEAGVPRPLPVAQRVLKVHQVDRPVPAVVRPLGRGWRPRSNRGFSRRPKR
jgi:hypothetical protein